MQQRKPRQRLQSRQVIHNMKNRGKVKELVLDRSVIKPIQQNRLGIEKGASVGSDCAFFNNTAIGIGYVAMDSVDAVKLAIIQACNNLWASMAEPNVIMLSISLPENYREIKIKDIMKKACDTATELQIKIGGGHTEYVPGLTAPVFSVTAVGQADRLQQEITIENYDIVMTKWMGLSGTSILAKEKRNELITRLPEYYVDEAATFIRFASIADEAKLAKMQSETIAMHDVAGGGIFTALWEMGEKLQKGFEVELSNIPVMQETIEICEYFDKNPYKLRSDGSLLIATSDGESLCKILRENNINAVVLGRTTDNLDRIVRREEDVRYLEPGNGDEIYELMW